MDTSTFESCNYSFDSFTFAEGIATESHGQNIILVHKQGWPTRVLLKDFHDGVRYSPAHLAHPELAPELDQLPPEHAKPTVCHLF